MRRLHTLALAALCSVIAGCNSSDVYHNLTRAQKPTINSDKPVRVFTALGGNHVADVEATGLKTESPDDDQFEFKANGEETLDSSLGMAYAFSENYEATFTSFSNGGTKLGIKAALPAPDSLTQDFVHAVALTLGYQKYEGNYIERTTGSNEYDFDSDRTDLIYEREAIIVDLAYIAGLKISENVMIYGGPFYIKTNTDSEQQSLSTDVNSADGFLLHQLTLDTDITGVNLAVSWEGDSGFGVTYEYSGYGIDFDDTSDGGSVWAVTLEYNF